MTVYKVLQGTHLLPSGISSHSPKKWVKQLKNDPKNLVALLNATCQNSDLYKGRKITELYKGVRKLSSSVQKELSNQLGQKNNIAKVTAIRDAIISTANYSTIGELKSLADRANTILSQNQLKAKAPSVISKKAPAASTQHNNAVAVLSPPRLLNNIGASCWMNSVLQLLATTRFYDSIHNQRVSAIGGNHTPDEFRKLMELRTALHSVIEDLRAAKRVDAERLSNLRKLLFEAHIIDNQNGGQDASEVLRRLATSMGQTQSLNVNRVTRFNNLDVANPDPEITNAIDLAGAHQNDSMQQLLQNYFQGHHVFVVRNGQGQDIAIADGDYERAACLQQLQNQHPQAPVTEEAIRQQQQAHILHTYPNATAVNLAYTLDPDNQTIERRDIANFPHVIQIDAARPGPQITVNNILNLSQFGRNQGQNGHYLLQGAICRSGDANNGHFFYLHKNAQNQWIRFDDAQMSNLTNAQAVQILGEFGRSFFYTNVVPAAVQN